VLALLCSILHYIFFDQLNGSIASGDNARISQSYTTAISLLLVTLFKASLLGSVGVCSAQYLGASYVASPSRWLRLRASSR
jgi:fucose 4-O-acetylase-like acetyltransferase